MASTFVATGTYSNLTRLQLEQLRKADFFAGSKALTVGDSALPPEGVVGPGDINAEPFLTGPSVLLDDVYALTPAQQPGPGLGTQDQPGVFISETTRWYGPQYIADGTSGFAASINSWEDDSGVNFILEGVLAGDILLIKPGNSANFNAVATVTVVLSANTLILGDIKTRTGGTLLTIDLSTNTSGYLIVRPNALQLFAVPASGATGFEQTFLAVNPGSSLHNNVAPTTDQINADRIKNLVPSQYALNALVDRADSVFDAPAPRTSLDKLGYRIVLYPDNGSGTGPNLSTPIATLNPVIDPGIVATDQRFTVDYKAGVIRFSCAPQLGGQIKVAGGVNATTGRLNLYAVFWAVDTSLTKGSARTLYGLRSTTSGALTPGRVTYDTTNNAWRMGATSSTNAFAVVAPDPSEDARHSTSFGTFDPTATNLKFRYFTYRQGSSQWKFVNSDIEINEDTPSAVEMPVGQALQLTVADTAGPPFGGADFIPEFTVGSSTFGRGLRDTDTPLTSALAAAAIGDFTSIVRLKRGRYFVHSGTINVPPGVVIEGDGPNTLIQVHNITAASNTTITPGFKFGPNTPWGVYDLTWDGTKVNPHIFDYSSSNVAQRLEGVGVVWNPVRRVWGVAWADLNLDAIWFNEIHRDGSTTFPGFGINVKTTANPLFSNLSPNSSNHTGGHYPRLCHQANNDAYGCTWVDQVTISAVVGPRVYIQAFQITPANTDPTPGNPSGTIASVSYITSPACDVMGTLTGSPYFSDHPSIAADNSSTSPFWPMFITCWAYIPSAGVLTNSSAQTASFQISGVPTVISSESIGSSVPQPVISSTDVDEDGAGNGMFVWSRRLHPLLTGTQGTFNGSQQFTDPSVSNWTTNGIVSVGSKFCYLGATGAFAFPYDSTFGVSHLGSVKPVTPYGTDGTVTTVNSGNILIKANFTGLLYNIGVPYTVFSSTYTSVSGTTLTDNSTDFTTNGVQVGDNLITLNNGDSVAITVIAPGGNHHQVTVSGTLFTSINKSYNVYYARPFHWAIVPPSVIEGVQYTPASGFLVLNTLTIAGNSSPTSLTDYSLEPIEPDFVRIRHGGDNYLVVYQSFQTTSYLSHESVTNWNDNQTTAGGASPGTIFDSTLYLRETGGSWRKHISTCVVVLSANGVSLNTLSGALATVGSAGANLTVNFDTKASRDTEISGRSLGAIWDPVTYRPNCIQPIGYLSGGVLSQSLYRYPWNMANEVSFLSGAQRMTTSIPGLIPDVTWTGEDWVVVSPTKKALHGYTGNYFVDGSGNVIFSDPAFYFGTGGTSSVDGNLLRQTVEVGDKIWFPSISAYATIGSIYNEHTVRLNESNASLFNYGLSSQTPNVEWALVRTGINGSRPGGIRSLGYRVGLNGQTIISSSYMTFADELPENSWQANNVPDRTALMQRSNYDRSFYWFNLAPATSNAWSDGHNLPGNIQDDIPDPEARYMGDVGFRGVAPGNPHGCNDQLLGEGSFCALAWGENFYGYMEHIAEGYTGNSNATNQVRFYRQSFGPYNSGMRNLKIASYYSPPVNGPIFQPSGTELKVLTKQLVYTRHGAPTQSNGFFATDGFRNCFGVAANRGLLFLNSFFVPEQLPFDGASQPCIRAFYTDAVGRFPIEMQGPETQNKALPGTISVQSTFRSDFGILYNNQGVAIQPAAPRVIWDGQRFIAVWVEGGFEFFNPNPMLCFATFPGGEDTGLQGPEMVNPNDIWVLRRPFSLSFVESRANVLNTDASNFTVLDVAFSGRVYAVLWASGLDTNAPGDVGNVPGGVGGVLGVTLVDSSSIGGTYFDYDPQPYLTCETGQTNGSGLTDANPAFTTTSPGTSAFIQPGDTCLIQGSVGTSPFTQNAGRYLVTGISSGQLDLYPTPPLSGVTDTLYSLHHPLPPSGAASYIIGQMGWPSGVGRDSYTQPSVIWDGKAFVAVWRARMQGGVLPAQIQDEVKNLQCLTFPETGPGGHAPQLRRAGGQGGTSASYINTTPFGPQAGSAGIGLTQPNSTNPFVLFLVSPYFYLTSSTGTTLNATLLQDTSTNFIGAGVAQGDYVVITSGSAVYGYGTIQFVNTNIIGISSDYGGFTTFAGGQTYQIFRRQYIKAQKGDIVRVGTLSFGGTIHADNVGDVAIFEFDSRNNAILFPSGYYFRSTVGVSVPGVFGSIVSGAGNGDLLQQQSTFGNYFGFDVGVGTDISPNPRPIGSSLVVASTASGITPIGAYPDHLYKIAYNEMTDEYAVLYSLGPRLAIGVFDRQSFEIRKETVLYVGGQPIKCADMAWNGTRYMVVFATGGLALAGNNPIPLQYRLLTGNLQIEDQGQTESGVTNGFGIDTIYNIVGNAVGNVPGPTYEFPNISTTNIAPLWKNCQVRWNNRLNRWVVSGSVLWTSYISGHMTKFDIYGTVPPAISTTSAQTLEYASEYPLTNASITSVSGNVITIHDTNAVEVNYLCPGLKLGWIDGTGATKGWAGMTAILATASIGGNNYTITCATSSFGPFPGSTKLFVLTREDCFLYTLGTDTPAVQFEDADGCFLENVTFAGGGADIEEKYTRMSRPIWQSGGPAVGFPSATGENVYSVQRASQYNHRFMTPTMKVETLRTSNVKSFTKSRYGTGFIPGNPYFDRYYQPREGKG